MRPNTTRRLEMRRIDGSCGAELVLGSDRIRLFAPVEAGDPEAIDVYLSEDETQHALTDCLRDEPDWRDLLRVEEIEFNGVSVSSNQEGPAKRLAKRAAN